MANLLDRSVRYSLGGGLPLWLTVLALLLGAVALQWTPREEEPQIVVPMLDVLVSAPGLSAEQVSRQVSVPLEKLLIQIPGVEHLYSRSATGQSTVTLRFHVGEDREEALLNTYNKLYANQHQVPAVVSRWQLQPVEVDDVPIVVLGLWSRDASRYDDYSLRRIAQEIAIELQALPQTSEVKVVGGRPRAVQILLDPEQMAARQTTSQDILQAIQLSNRRIAAGTWSSDNQSIVLEAGDMLTGADDLQQLLVNVINGNPVFLQDVATVIDGPVEADHYSWLTMTAGGDDSNPMVAISVAKQRGSNAVSVSAAIRERIDTLSSELLPPGIGIHWLRDYGDTANEKVRNLTLSLAFAVVTVVVFMGIFLGWRQALVVGLAVPVCYGITLILDMAFGYTINRVTLFALILSLGLLVDDPITGVDNITRFLQDPDQNGKSEDRIVAAMAEIRRPLLMSTLTIVLAFLPLAFITGMMGPYMAPMAFNVPVSVIASTAVAFLVTPWLTWRLLGNTPPADQPATPRQSAYSRLIKPLLVVPARGRWLVFAMLALFIMALSLPLFRLVPLKLLPFDNKNEIQVVIDLPESASLEQTAAVTRQVSAIARQLPEVTAVAAFVGVASPMDFNGMVRGYYQRQAPHQAELRINLLDKTLREDQSHAIVLRLRQLLAPLQQPGLRIKVVEVPPGPPVLSTLVAEVYADRLLDYPQQQQAARQLQARLQREPGVVEVDTTVNYPQLRWRFVADKTKAALSGIATEDINRVLALANHGEIAGYLDDPREAAPLPVLLRLPQAERRFAGDLLRLQVKSRPGVIQDTSDGGLDDRPQSLVAIGELGSFVEGQADPVIHRKDLQPVVYVTAELNGRTPAEVIADLVADQNRTGTDFIAPADRHFLNNGGGDGWQVPQGIHIRWTGEGEWRITVDVFRDMGLAFAFALVAIFIVLRIQTGSLALALIIMSAIPLTMIGIMPGFWLLNQLGDHSVANTTDPVLFTATAMIGMIALAGIVVRNSLILVEFIDQRRAEGDAIIDALLAAGSVRMRPVLLTAGTTLLGNLVIILDPVFSGLALAIIFGIIASTLFTLIVIPIIYFWVFNTDHTFQPTGNTP